MSLNMKVLTFYALWDTETLRSVFCNGRAKTQKKLGFFWYLWYSPPYNCDRHLVAHLNCLGAWNTQWVGKSRDSSKTFPSCFSNHWDHLLSLNFEALSVAFISLQAVQRQLEELEERQRALEIFGVELERELRGESGTQSSVCLFGGGFFNLFQSRGV